MAALHAQLTINTCCIYHQIVYICDTYRIKCPIPIVTVVHCFVVRNFNDPTKVQIREVWCNSNQMPLIDIHPPDLNKFYKISIKSIR